MERGPSGVSLATLALGWLIGRLSGDRRQDQDRPDPRVVYHQRR